MNSSSSRRMPRNLEERLNDVYAHAEAMQSESSISSTVTANSLPGAGRTLDKLFQFLGRRLEMEASRFMERRGYGPEEAKKRISSMRKNDGDKLPGCSCPRCLLKIAPVPNTKEDKILKKDIKKILGYVTSPVITNHELACEAITELAILDDFVRQVFLHMNAIDIIALASRKAGCYHSEPLLSPSRKALICLADTEINTLGKEALQVFHRLNSQVSRLGKFNNGIGPLEKVGLMPTDQIERFYDLQQILNEKARYSDIAHIAVQYLRNILCLRPYFSWKEIVQLDMETLDELMQEVPRDITSKQVYFTLYMRFRESIHARKIITGAGTLVGTDNIPRLGNIPVKIRMISLSFHRIVLLLTHTENKTCTQLRMAETKDQDQDQDQDQMPRIHVADSQWSRDSDSLSSVRILGK